MSMSTYGIKDTGLLITDEIAAYIVLAVERENNNVPAAVQSALDDGSFRQKVLDKSPEIPEDYLDIAFAHECLEEKGVGDIYYSAFEGSASTLQLPGNAETDLRTWEYDDDYIAYLPTKAPNLFKAVYSSPDELVQELRARLEGILPKDFDLRPYIADIDGTCVA